ncbi:zf-HC2 domain-containing protein [Propionibacteriaceae bacterium G1746]
MIQRDPLPVACREARQALDAVLDDVASSQTSQQVQHHLAECPDCSAAAGEVKNVVSALRDARPAEAPADLSARLAAIAGAEASDPLWLSRPGDGVLPSPRRALRKGALTGSAAVLACVGVLFTLGLMLAPPLPVISDPGAAADREFDLSLGIGPGAQAVNAVVASAQGGQLSPTPTIDRPGLMTSLAWSRITHDQALSMLLNSVQAQVGYVGIQRVTLSGQQGYVTADVQVAQQPGTGVSVAVLNSSGAVISSGMMPANQGDVINTLPPSAEFFRMTDGGTIAGHRAVLLEGKRADRSLVARWWLAPDLGLVLWNETFDATGQLVRSAGFTELGLTSNMPSQASQVPLQLSKAPAEVASATGAMCTGGFSCASDLAGFRLQSISSDSPHNPDVVHAVYEKDGVCVTVLQQRGRLGDIAAAKSLGVSADRSTVTWQSGGVVYTVTTNAGPSVAQVVAGELPHQEPASMHPVKRSWSGLARLVGLGPR